ncbi:hypothetical protein D1007_33137 [Hordeum vulgare]|nr:hypothetical protein D1007_33137 [Hordeum vulgare]
MEAELNGHCSGSANEDKRFVLNFSTEEDRRFVLKAQPWHYKRDKVIFAEFDDKGNPAEVDLGVMAIWVQNIGGCVVKVTRAVGDLMVKDKVTLVASTTTETLGGPSMEGLRIGQEGRVHESPTLALPCVGHSREDLPVPLTAPVDFGREGQGLAGGGYTPQVNLHGQEGRVVQRISAATQPSPTMTLPGAGQGREDLPVPLMAPTDSGQEGRGCTLQVQMHGQEGRVVQRLGDAAVHVECTDGQKGQGNSAFGSTSTVLVELLVQGGEETCV